MFESFLQTVTLLGNQPLTESQEIVLQASFPISSIQFHGRRHAPRTVVSSNARLDSLSALLGLMSIFSQIARANVRGADMRPYICQPLSTPFLRNTDLPGTRTKILITLVAIIAILGASLGLVYTNLSGQINSLNSNLQAKTTSLNALNSTYLDYKASHSYSNTAYDSLNTTYQNYAITHSHNNTEFELVNDIVNLRKSSTLYFYHNINIPLNYYWTKNFTFNFPGYIKIEIHTSTTNNTVVEAFYTASNIGVAFTTSAVNVGAQGTAYLHVLPSDNYEIRIYDQSNSAANVTFSATYYY